VRDVFKLRILSLVADVLREFTEGRPELRAKFLQIMSADLAARLNESPQA
jgi:hypothetical protein